MTVRLFSSNGPLVLFSNPGLGLRLAFSRWRDGECDRDGDRRRFRVGSLLGRQGAGNLNRKPSILAEETLS